MATAAQKRNSGLAFRDPGPPKKGSGSGRGGTWVRILTPLMDFPDEWVVVSEKDSLVAASATANNLRRRIVKMPEGRWAFSTRTMNPGPSAEIFAKYLGPE